MKSVSGLSHWSPGILTRLLQDLKTGTGYRQTCNSTPHSAVKHWVVLEGPMNAGVMEKLTELLSPSGLHLSCGEVIHLSGRSGIRVGYLSLPVPSSKQTKGGR